MTISLGVIRTHARGRSRGRLTAKIHMQCDSSRVQLKFIISGGKVSGIACTQPLLDEPNHCPVKARAYPIAATGRQLVKLRVGNGGMFLDHRPRP